MAQTLVKFPGWITALLHQWGLSVDDALAEFNELAAKYEVPEEWRAAVEAWAKDLSIKVQDPGAAQALILAIYLELTGTPGYWKDHGGVA